MDGSMPVAFRAAMDVGTLSLKGIKMHSAPRRRPFHSIACPEGAGDAAYFPLRSGGNITNRAAAQIWANI